MKYRVRIQETVTLELEVEAENEEEARETAAENRHALDHFLWCDECDVIEIEPLS